MFTKYVSGAEEEISEVYRYASGAEQEAEAVYKYVNGAEEEVWSNAKDLSIIERTTKTGAFFSNEGDWENSAWIVGVDDSGYVILAVDGEFVNPTISYTVSGALTHHTSDGTAVALSPANIYTYSVTSLGVSEANLTPVNKDGSEETYTYALSGTFTRVGLKIKLQNWQIGETGFTFLSHIMIDGKKYVTRAEDEYNYNDW